jgi:hypothetical protein
VVFLPFVLMTREDSPSFSPDFTRPACILMEQVKTCHHKSLVNLPMFVIFFLLVDAFVFGGFLSRKDPPETGKGSLLPEPPPLMENISDHGGQGHERGCLLVGEGQPPIITSRRNP